MFVLVFSYVVEISTSDISLNPYIWYDIKVLIESWAASEMEYFPYTI